MSKLRAYAKPSKKVEPGHNDKIGHRNRRYEQSRTESLAVVNTSNDHLISYWSNFESTTEDCNAYYKHPLFVSSRRLNDWKRASDSSQFAYRLTPQYKSLELFWNEKCEICGTQRTNA